MSTFEMPEPAEELSAVDEAAPAKNESDSVAFFRTVKKLGKEAALGKESLPALVGVIAAAVGDGALTPKDKFPGKDGTPNGRNAAQYIFDTYADGAAAKALHERTESSIRVQTSKIKQIIDASAKAEPQNFRGALTRAVEMRKGIDKKQLKPAFDAYLDMARGILKSDVDLSDDDILTANTKPTKTSSTVLDELKKAYQVVKKLLSNEAADKPRVYSHDPRFDMLDKMRGDLLDMIRQEEPAYDVPKPPKSEAAGDTSTNGEEDEEGEAAEGEDESPDAAETAPVGTEDSAEEGLATPEVQVQFGVQPQAAE